MEKQKATIIAAAIVAVGLALLGFFVKCGFDSLASVDRQVTVKGLAEREVKANRVTWPICYDVAGDNLLSLYDEVTRYNDVIMKFLASNGIESDEIVVNPPSTYNASANLYNSNASNFKYSLSCTVTVRTSKVEKVRQLLGRQSELLKEGVPYSNSYINYEYTLLNDIKPEMIAQATRNAREAADRFAQDSGSKVGGMKSAVQGQFSIEDVNSDPYIKKVRVVTTVAYYLK